MHATVIVASSAPTITSWQPHVRQQPSIKSTSMTVSLHRGGNGGAGRRPAAMHDGQNEIARGLGERPFEVLAETGNSENCWREAAPAEPFAQRSGQLVDAVEVSLRVGREELIPRSLWVHGIVLSCWGYQGREMQARRQNSFVSSHV